MAHRAHIKAPQRPLKVELRTILTNLIILFLLTTIMSVVIAHRQLVEANESTHVEQHFAAGMILLRLNERNLQLHQLLSSKGQAAVAQTAIASDDYGVMRQRIETDLKNLEKNEATIESSRLPRTQIDHYVSNWQQFDSIMQASAVRELQSTEYSDLADYLLKMERATTDLLQSNQAYFRQVQGNAVDLSTRYRYLFFATMLILWILVSWTILQFWQFIKEYQAISTELQVSERRHRTLLETIPDIVLRRTRAGIYTDFKAANTFGRFMPSRDFIGKHISEILPPDIAQQSTEATIRALDSGEEQIYEYRMVSRTNNVLTDYEARVLPSGADEVQVIVRDITEEKLRNERQQQAQKLESLGMLAGGIAHDFNNLLTSIMAQISLANAKLQRGQQPLEQIEKALTATERAADLTRQLLTYAGQASVQVTAIELNRLIQDNVGLWETALPNGAELRLSLADELPLIEADRGHIQQVLMNIALNAADALRQKALPEHAIGDSALEDEPVEGLEKDIKKLRHIFIATKIEKIFEGQKAHDILGKALQPGIYVSLCIQDNGVGMDSETVKRIFDPFFSTKEHGHGLGLSAILGIVRGYGGAIWVDSQYGVGTAFTLLFPAVDKTKVNTGTTQENETIPRYDSMPQILVIDDESSIREVVTDILQAKGFTVYQASNGEEGIAKVQQMQGAVDLVLLDMKMPGLSGDETLEELHRIEPSLKVILSSGFTQSEVGAKLRNQAAVDFLPKPYSQEQLLKTIHQALASPAVP